MGLAAIAEVCILKDLIVWPSASRKVLGIFLTILERKNCTYGRILRNVFVAKMEFIAVVSVLLLQVEEDILNLGAVG